MTLTTKATLATVGALGVALGTPLPELADPQTIDVAQLGVGGVALWAFVRLVGKVSIMADRLGRWLDSEEEHRKREREHWRNEESALSAIRSEVGSP